MPAPGRPLYSDLPQGARMKLIFCEDKDSSNLLDCRNFDYFSSAQQKVLEHKGKIRDVDWPGFFVWGIG